MLAVPLLGYRAQAHPGQIWPGTLGAPQEGMLPHIFTAHGIRAEAFRFRAQRPHHLGVAHMAAFADINIPAFHLQGGVGLQGFQRLGGRFLPEQRHDLCEPAETDGDQCQHNHEADILFYYFMSVRHVVLLSQPAARCLHRGSRVRHGRFYRH